MPDSGPRGVPIQVLRGVPIQVLGGANSGPRGVPNSGPWGGPVQVLEGVPNSGPKGGPNSGPRVDVEKREQRSALEAPWALGALEPKKGLKRPNARVGLWWKGCRKQPPRAAVFCHLFADT